MNRSKCPQCGPEDGAGDNLIEYQDNYHCHACGFHKRKTGNSVVYSYKKPPKVTNLLIGKVITKPIRGISPETFAYCNTTGIIYSGWVRKDVNVTNEVCIIHGTSDGVGTIVHQKIKSLNDKKIQMQEGDRGCNLLYGLSLFSPDNSKFIIVTEGEWDCLSVYDVTKYASCSLKKGTDGAYQEIVANLEQLQKFPYVILWFDNDEVGKAAIEKCLPLFEPGKVRVINSAIYKDANDLLCNCTNGMKFDTEYKRINYIKKQMMSHIYEAQEYRPEGVITASSISKIDFFKPEPEGIGIPYEKLNSMTRGLQPGRILTIMAEPGVGKSTLCKEIGYHLIVKKKLRVGNIFLEEGQKSSIKSYFAIHNNIPLWKLAEHPEQVGIDKLLGEDWDLLMGDNVLYYDHFGSLDAASLMSKLKYMAVVCDVIILDHISIAISGDTGSGQGERKDIDILMTGIRSMLERTGVSMVLVTHITKQNRVNSKGEPIRLNMNDARGSGSIPQISDTILALETDMTMWLLKNRYTGRKGFAGVLEYNNSTGRLLTKNDDEEIEI